MSPAVLAIAPASDMTQVIESSVMMRCMPTPSINDFWYRAWPLVLLCMCLWPMSGCLRTQRGDTLLDVRTNAQDEERVIRRKLWRVERSLEQIRADYGMDDLVVEVKVTDLGGLGQTSPAVSGLASVSGAKIVLSKDIFLDQHEDLDDIITGLLAHEMMHAAHYAELSARDLISLGRHYQAMMHEPTAEEYAWVRTYERLTDMLTIRLGYGEALVHQKWASEANVAANHPPHVWAFYLTEPEIRAYMTDRDRLDADIATSIEALHLSSFHPVRALVGAVVNHHAESPPSATAQP